MSDNSNIKNVQKVSTLKKRVEELKKIYGNEKIDLLFNDKGYNDPITLEVMDDPVILSDKQTYQRETAEDLFKKNTISPVTREVLDKTIIEPNVKMLSAIWDIVEAQEAAFDKINAQQMVEVAY